MKTKIIIVAAVLLAGCAEPARLVGSDGDVLVIETRSPNPIYAAGLIEGADAQCPAGWTKIGDEVTTAASSYLIQWRIRCRVPVKD